jgi:phosphoribosylglycinamide formyltransferase 2
VTLGGTQNLSEFELHCRAVLGLPIPEITLERAGASAVVLAEAESQNRPEYSGVEDALALSKIDVRVFGKPTTRKYRRMAVALAFDTPATNTDELRARATQAADLVKVIVR